MSKRERNDWIFNAETVYVLGLDYEVKDSISWRDAVTDILQGTMTPFMVHPTKRIHSAGGTVDMAWPIIVRLNYWIDKPYDKNKVIDIDSHSSSRNIRERDLHTCAYCGKYANTVDHIKPESLCKKDGDPHNGWTWGNLVAACKKCNNKKRNRYPEEAGMKLLWTPHTNGVGNYSLVQSKVWEILKDGEGYVTESTPEEGILKKEKKIKNR